MPEKKPMDKPREITLTKCGECGDYEVKFTDRCNCPIWHDTDKDVKVRVKE